MLLEWLLVEATAISTTYSRMTGTSYAGHSTGAPGSTATKSLGVDLGQEQQVHDIGDWLDPSGTWRGIWAVVPMLDFLALRRKKPGQIHTV
ncbi:hypothetical protein DPEC_G00059490 [Dallia pectoralis]|uniref:Uncharacterized protein n=1 Tax=Dallia pectoralis TaxID=75939 RepID=A0ACC2H7P9_DALPE|nr:hypothetical protein DPEC_G00059490 [Dallia pectoralis]